MLDLTRVLAGPTCARTLAEHGADVMKIAGPHLPFNEGRNTIRATASCPPTWTCGSSQDVDTLRGWCGTRIFSPRATGPAPWPSGAWPREDLAEMRPGIVYVSLCAFGRVGPWAERRGFDTVVQTVSGITHRQGELVPRGASRGRSSTRCRPLTT